MTAFHLPPALKSAIDARLEGVSRKDLTRRAAAVSDNYRQGGPSRKTILDPADGLSYLLARLPATYAATAAALAQVKSAMPGFAPRSVLDVGAGPGTASWAACEAFPSLETATLIDDNAPFRQLALGLACEHPVLSRAAYGSHDLCSLREALPPADLVIASYALGELPAPPLAALWQAAKGVLLIVEPGTPASFARIVSWRAALLKEQATLAAPCPHHQPCPIVKPDWCHFAQRLPRSRDHMILKEATVPFEDEKFSYVAASRLPVTQRPEGRVLMPPRHDPGKITCKTCTEGRIDLVTAGKRNKAAYKALNKARWGDGLEIAKAMRGKIM
jgi:ribosomal protein RSM22 (predicted rRNA methylase)